MKAAVFISFQCLNSLFCYMFTEKCIILEGYKAFYHIVRIKYSKGCIWGMNKIDHKMFLVLQLIH